MTLVYFLLILGIIIFIHELGHFLFAKLFKVYVYEFSLGMGPRLFKYKPKGDETEYSLRLFPIGGYVKIAGEDDSDDDTIPKNRQLSSKSWRQRFVVTVTGSIFNMILALIIIFVLALSLGSVSTKPIIGKAVEGYPAYAAGITSGDLVLSVNGANTASYDELILQLYKDKDHKVDLEIEKKDGSIVTYHLTAKAEKGYYVYGVTASVDRDYGIIHSLSYTGTKFIALIHTMGISLMSLITGDIAVDQFSGPVGVYDMVDNQVAAGFGNVAYFIAYLSINIGFINLLPIPALDGGRILFLVIEKIKGSKVDPKIESLIHFIGFILLMGLILLITFNDIFG